MSPDAQHMLKSKLLRQGIAVTPAQADTLTQQLVLVASGRRPSALRPARLVRPYALGNGGLHGFVAESVLMASDESLHFSRNNSISSDYTRRDADMRVKAHGQVKCHSTLGSSRSGIIDSFIKFNRNEYHSSRGTPFEGVIPKDQFDQMRQSGEIDSEGRLADRKAFRERIRERVEWARNSPALGSTNRDALISGGERLLNASDADLDRLRFMAHPSEYSELRQSTMDYQAASYGKQSPLAGPDVSAAPSSPALQRGQRGGLMAMMLGVALFDAGSLGTRGLSAIRPLDVIAAGQGVLEPAAEMKGSHKRAIEKVLRHIPRSLRPGLPGVDKIRAVGRWAGRAGPWVAAAFLVYESYRFASGTTDARGYSGSVASIAGGAAGFAAGALIGGTVGSVVPVVGNAMGALVGGLCGAWVGGMMGQAASESVFDHLDARDLQMYIEVVQSQYRMYPPVR